MAHLAAGRDELRARVAEEGRAAARAELRRVEKALYDLNLDSTEEINRLRRPVEAKDRDVVRLSSIIANMSRPP
jgi:hypothetical protein